MSSKRKAKFSSSKRPTLSLKGKEKLHALEGFRGKVGIKGSNPLLNSKAQIHALDDIKGKVVNKGSNLPKKTKSIVLFCKPSKVISINEFLNQQTSAQSKSERCQYIRRAGFGFLLDLAIPDPKREAVMDVVNFCEDDKKPVLSEEYVRSLYGLDFGFEEIDVDKPMSPKQNKTFKIEATLMGLEWTGPLFVSTKNLEKLLRRTGSDVLMDYDWAKVYIMYALAVFLVAPKSGVISAKYWHYFDNLSQVARFNWTKHFARKMNDEFSHCLQSMKTAELVKVGGNTHLLLDYFNSDNRETAPRPHTGTTSSVHYDNMSLSMLYASHYKLIQQREALDAEIAIVRLLITHRERGEKGRKDADAIEEEVGADADNQKEKEVDEEGMGDGVDVKVDGVGIEDDDDVFTQVDNFVDPDVATVAGSNDDKQTDDALKRKFEEVEANDAGVKRFKQDQPADGADWSVVEYVAKQALDELFNTQFFEEADRVVDKLVGSSKVEAIPQPDLDMHSITMDKVDESASPGHKQKNVDVDKRQTTKSYALRTPYTDPRQKKKKLKKSQASKTMNKPMENVDEDPDFKVVEGDDFVSAPPRRFRRDFEVTPALIDKALMCYTSMTVHQKELLVRYVWDRDLLKEIPGETVAFDKITYLVRHDVATLRGREWVASAVVDAYARVEARRVHSQGRHIDRIIFPIQVANKITETKQVCDSTQGIDIQHDEFGKTLMEAVQCSYPFSKDYLAEIDYWFFPYCNDIHFTTYVIDTKNKGCFILDSFENIGERLAYDMVVRGAYYVNYIATFLKNIKNIDIYQFSPWKILDKVPKQDDTFSCGIFACKYMELYTHEWAAAIPPFEWADKKVIAKTRKEISRNLLADPDNLLLPQLLESALEWNGQQKKVSLGQPRMNTRRTTAARK